MSRIRRGAIAVVVALIGVVVPTAAPVAHAAPNVFLSGRVTAPNGSPLAGVEVFTLGGASGTTFSDAQGHYTLALEVAAPTSLWIEAAPPEASTFLGSAFPASETLMAIAPGDSRTGLDLRLIQGYPVEVDILAPDGSPNSEPSAFPVACTSPLMPTVDAPGTCPSDARHRMRITAMSTSHLSTLMPAGVVNIAGYRLTGGGIVPGEQSQATTLVIVPGTTSSCAFRLVGGPAACTSSGPATTADDDGVDPEIEDQAPGADGNGDGTPDRDQGHVASTSDTTFTTPVGTSFALAERMPTNTGWPPRPAGITLTPFGAIRFALGGLAAGGSVDVRMRSTFVPDQSPNTYLRLSGTTWNAAAVGLLELTRDGAVWHLVDGGRGDDDGVANGQIVHMGVLAFDEAQPPLTFPEYVAVAPARLLDTRTDPGLSTVDGQQLGAGLQAAGSVVELAVAGRAGVPQDAKAAVLNIAVTRPTGAGFVTAFPCGSERPTAANLNYAADQTIPNGVIAKIGDGGKICVFTYAPAHLVIDLNGYVPANSPYVPLSPARLLETRAEPGLTTVDGASVGIGIRDAGSVTELQIGGRGGAPDHVAAVALNVAVTGATAPGYLTVFPCDVSRPTAASLNHGVGETIANNVLAAVGADGKVCIYSYGTTHVVVDLNGYVPVGSDYTPLTPARLLDTRAEPGLTTVDGQQLGSGLPAAGAVVELQVAGRADVPADATAAVLNVAVTGATAPGFVTVYPCGTERPTAANLNYVADQTIPNGVVAKIGAAGTVCLFTYAPAHLVVDLNGYFPAS